MTRALILGALLTVSVFLLGGCGGEPEAGPGPDAGAARSFCEAPLRACGDDCVSVANDPRHCGACFTECPEGSFCDRGGCSEVCSPGTTECAGACADLSTDRAHCGGCNQPCAGDRMCVGGGCVCPPGTEDCGGACVDVQTSLRHCGQCNLACENDELCSAGECVCRTGTRETDCTDGFDDDCDGLVDCADPDCEGATRRCNGSCGAGAETCASGAWGECVGGSGEAEICGDGVDNDCVGGDERAPDAFEPNDDCTQCPFLQPEADPMLTLVASFDSVDDGVDCFRFVAEDNTSYRERIRITLDQIPEGHDYDLFLYVDQQACQAQDALAYSIELGDADESIDWGEAFGVSDSGTYFVRVVRFSGHSCTDGYRLTVDGLR